MAVFTKSPPSYVLASTLSLILASCGTSPSDGERVEGGDPSGTSGAAPEIPLPDTAAPDPGDSEPGDSESGDPEPNDPGSSGSTGDPEPEEGEACADGPLEVPRPGCRPSLLPSTGDPQQDCVDRINQLRWECQCLPPLQRWVDAEACSDEQSRSDQDGGGPHGNFGACGEFAQNTCPGWPSTADVVDGCLQAMWDEGPGEPYSAHGHYINMTNPEYTKVACGFSSSSGGVWSNQNFSN